MRMHNSSESITKKGSDAIPCIDNSVSEKDIPVIIYGDRNINNERKNPDYSSNYKKNQQKKTVKIKNLNGLENFLKSIQNEEGKVTIPKEMELDLSEYSNFTQDIFLDLNKITKIEGKIILPKNLKVLLMDGITSVDDLKNEDGSSIMPSKNMIWLSLNGLENSKGLVEILNNFEELGVIGLNSLTYLEDNLINKLSEMMQIKEDKNSVLSTIELRGMNIIDLIKKDEEYQNMNLNDLEEDEFRKIGVKYLKNFFNLEKTGSLSFIFKDKILDDMIVRDENLEETGETFSQVRESDNEPLFDFESYKTQIRELENKLIEIKENEENIEKRYEKINKLKLSIELIIKNFEDLEKNFSSNKNYVELLNQAKNIEREIQNELNEIEHLQNLQKELESQNLVGKLKIEDQEFSEKIVSSFEEEEKNKEKEKNENKIITITDLKNFYEKNQDENGKVTIPKGIVLDLSEYRYSILDLNKITKIEGEIILPKNLKVLLMDGITSANDLMDSNKNSILPNNDLFFLSLNGLENSTGLVTLLDNLDNLQAINLNGLTSLDDDLKDKLNEMIKVKKDKLSKLASIELRGINIMDLIRKDKNIKINKNDDLNDIIKNYLYNIFNLEEKSVLTLDFEDKIVNITNFANNYEEDNFRIESQNNEDSFNLGNYLEGIIKLENIEKKIEIITNRLHQLKNNIESSENSKTQEQIENEKNSLLKQLNELNQKFNTLINPQQQNDPNLSYTQQNIYSNYIGILRKLSNNNNDNLEEAYDLVKTLTEKIQEMNEEIKSMDPKSKGYDALLNQRKILENLLRDLQNIIVKLEIQIKQNQQENQNTNQRQGEVKNENVSFTKNTVQNLIDIEKQNEMQNLKKEKEDVLIEKYVKKFMKQNYLIDFYDST